MAYWGSTDKLFLSLSGPQRAAAMALLEADARNPNDAKNALGAMINRAEAEGEPLGQSVSKSMYQPTIEDSQRARLASIVQSPEFAQLSALAESRARGQTPDWVSGADHFVAPPEVMLGLEAKAPDKYLNWGPRGANWTGYDPETGAYKNKVLEDGSHHFLKLYGDKPNATVAEAQSPTLVSPKPQGKDMDWLSALMGAFGGGGGSPPAAAGGGGMLADLFGGSGLGEAAPTAAPAATPSPTAPGSSGGMLSTLFGGKGDMGSDAGLTLAQNAMASAGGAKPALAPLSRNPIDMSRLQQMLAQRPMLGVRA